MKRVWLAVRTLAFGFVVSLPVWAAAPAAQYRPFEGGSLYITDQKTNLVWTRNATGQTSFADAKCATGRLPSLKELLTIFDEEPWPYYNDVAYENRYVDKSAFGPIGFSKNERTQPGPFWTSSYADVAKTKVWTLDFSTGEVAATAASLPGWTRCVDSN